MAINLLPPKEKEELIQEENLKLVLILGIFVLIFLVSLSLALLSIKLYISGEVSAQKIIFIEAQKELQDSPSQLLEEQVAQANKKITQLADFYQKQPKINKIIGIIAKDLPSGAYLSNLAADFSSGAPTLNLAGFSFDRETLLQFRDNLNGEKIFSQVDFPSFNWLEPTNINFSAVLKLK